MCLRALRKLWPDRAGNVAVIFALSSPVVIGGGALGVEAGVWYFDRLRIQQLADASAFAAAVEARAGNSVSTMTTAAQAAARDNGFNAATDTLVLHAPPTSGGNQNANSAEVLVTRTEPRFLSQMFTAKLQTVSARAVASYTTAGDACIFALDRSASQAVSFSGSSTVAMSGCDVMANSISPTSITGQGSTSVTVPCILSAGGVSLTGGVMETACAQPMTQLAPAADPLAGLAEPAVTGACQDPSANPFRPGRYCGGLQINGSASLQPGTYIIDGGTLRLNGNANVTGSGVTFYLANGAGVSMNGNSTLNLSPPISGALSGILFFGSRSNPSSSSVTINGTNGSTLTGTIYFPAQPVAYTGDMQGAGGCTQVIGKTVQWSGNASLAVNCSAWGMSPLAVGGVVKLVE